MAISVDDLPAKYQAQALRKIAGRKGPEQEVTGEGTSKHERKPSGKKYHNTQTERETDTGAVIHFDSLKEARRYDVLILLLRAGIIRDLRLQVDFTLQEAYTDSAGQRVRAIRYQADFTYRRQNGEEAWSLVVEDVKSRGTRTKEYIIKRKMMKERLGIDILEV